MRLKAVSELALTEGVSMCHRGTEDSDLVHRSVFTTSLKTCITYIYINKLRNIYDNLTKLADSARHKNLKIFKS